MRFTKVLAAAMAAMAIVSCSEQVTDLGENIQPGDAVLSFKVGTRGGTTYATEGEETAVNSLTAFLKYKNGSNVDAVMQVTASPAGINQTLASGTFTPGAAKLYLIANKAVTATTEAEILALTDNKPIYTNAGGELKLDATGMTATRELDINLQSGTVNTGTIGGTAITGNEVTLKRLAARVYASSTTTTATDIAGYKVDFAGTTSEANLFTYVGSGTGTAPAQYILKGDGAGQYSATEAVGYVYPSATDVTITVTNPDASDTRIVKFKPASNKNYKLLITPSTITPEGTKLEFTVKLTEYEEDATLGTVDFGVTTLNVKSGATLPTDFSVGTNGELVIANAVGNATSGVKILFSNLFSGAEANLKSFEVVSTYSLANYFKISDDGMFAVGDTDDDGLNFVALPNYGKDKTYKAKFTGWDGADEKTKKQYEITVIVKGMDLPANFTTTINGIEIMSVGYQGTLDATKTLVNTINGKTGNSFADKTLQYIKEDATNNPVTLKGTTYTGGYVKNNASTICPKGFEVPSQAQVFTLVNKSTGYDMTLAVGNNLLGGTTYLNWKSTETPPHYLLTDGSQTLLLPAQCNITTSQIGTVTATVKRIVFWDTAFQYVDASTAIQNTTIRCVKPVQTLLVH